MAQMLGEREREVKILLLEDDVMIASGVKYALETEGYKAYHYVEGIHNRSSIGKVLFDVCNVRIIHI